MWWHHLQMKIRGTMWSFPVTSFTMVVNQMKPQTSTKGHSMHKAKISCKENQVKRLPNQEELDEEQLFSWWKTGGPPAILYHGSTKGFHPRSICLICRAWSNFHHIYVVVYFTRPAEPQPFQTFPPLTSFCQSFSTRLWLGKGMWQESWLNVLVCLADKCRRCHGEPLRWRRAP